jgi:hypothetical protein
MSCVSYYCSAGQKSFITSTIEEKPKVYLNGLCRPLYMMMAGWTFRQLLDRY